MDQRRRRAPRRKSKGTDPLLQSYYWTVTVRNFWKRPENRRPCAWCGREIAYDAPRFYPGTRRVNPASLVIGHIVSRDEAKRLGWTDEQINALTNTRPEHSRCSDRSGAQYINQRRGRSRNPLSIVPNPTAPPTDRSRSW